MKVILAAATAALLAVDCGGTGFYKGVCSGDILGKIDGFINVSTHGEFQKAAEDHMKLAWESKKKKDFAECEKHVQAAKEAIWRDPDHGPLLDFVEKPKP